MRKIDVIFFVLIFILFTGIAYGEKAAAFQDFFKPAGLLVTENRMITYEKATVYIYSLDDYRLIKKFGKEGEGPQEFKQAVYCIYYIDGQLVVNSAGRVSYFTTDGEYIKEKKAIAGFTGDFCPMGDRFVGISVKMDGNTYYKVLALYDSNLAKIKEIHRVKADFQPGRIKTFPPPETFSVSGNKLFITSDEGFVIRVFDADGRKLRDIKTDYERLAVSEEHKKAVDVYHRTHPFFKKEYERMKKDMVFPSLLPAIKHVVFSEDGLYVETYGKAKGKTEFYVFDFAGKFLKKMFLPLVEPGGFKYMARGLYTVRNGDLYQLVENEEEEWEFHVTRVK